MNADTIEAHATVAVLHDRISELWRWRQWCRRQPNAVYWSPLRVEYETELRALVRLSRRARDLALPAIEREDARATELAAGDFYAYAVPA